MYVRTPTRAPTRRKNPVNFDDDDTLSLTKSNNLDLKYSGLSSEDRFMATFVGCKSFPIKTTTNTVFVSAATEGGQTYANSQLRLDTHAPGFGDHQFQFGRFFQYDGDVVPQLLFAFRKLTNSQTPDLPALVAIAGAS